MMNNSFNYLIFCQQIHQQLSDLSTADCIDQQHIAVFAAQVYS